MLSVGSENLSVLFQFYSIIELSSKYYHNIFWNRSKLTFNISIIQFCNIQISELKENSLELKYIAFKIKINIFVKKLFYTVEVHHVIFAKFEQSIFRNTLILAPLLICNKNQFEDKNASTIYLLFASMFRPNVSQIIFFHGHKINCTRCTVFLSYSPISS